MTKILVTGGAGFIGSYLCKKLLEEKYVVYCLDNLHRFGNEKIAGFLPDPNFKLIKADIRNKKEIKSYFDKVDCVIHLAAQSGVQGSLDDKDYSFETNVIGTWNVLRASEEKGVKKVIFASSREVYGNSKRKTSEENPLNPKNFYGASKVAGEYYLTQFRDYCNMDCYALRIANVYGPSDKGRAVPIFFEKALQNKAITVYGGEQVLDFIWIDDVIKVFIELIKTGSKYKTINVGSGKGLSIINLAEKIKKITNSKSRIKTEKTRVFDTQNFVAENSKMKKLIGKPTSFEKGITQMLI